MPVCRRRGHVQRPRGLPQRIQQFCTCTLQDRFNRSCGSFYGHTYTSDDTDSRSRLVHVLFQTVIQHVFQPQISPGRAFGRKTSFYFGNSGTSPHSGSFQLCSATRSSSRCLSHPLRISTLLGKCYIQQGDG